MNKLYSCIDQSDREDERRTSGGVFIVRVVDLRQRHSGVRGVEQQHVIDRRIVHRSDGDHSAHRRRGGGQTHGTQRQTEQARQHLHRAAGSQKRQMKDVSEASKRRQVVLLCHRTREEKTEQNKKNLNK
jgi:hypothetical protein